jgi:hypothetical protein
MFTYLPFLPIAPVARLVGLVGAVGAIRLFKMEGIVGEGVGEEEYTDMIESENNEEYADHEDILPGFKTFEEFREVGLIFIYLCQILG